MIEIRPLESDDIGALRMPAAQSYLHELGRQPEAARALAVPGLAFAGVVAGEIIGAAGVLPQWPGRAIAWALFSSAMFDGRVSRRDWVRITNEARRVLDLAHVEGWRRIEATVVVDLPRAQAWARRLGFEPEAVLSQYTPQGGDVVLFARLATRQAKFAKELAA